MYKFTTIAPAVSLLCLPSDLLILFRKISALPRYIAQNRLNVSCETVILTAACHSKSGRASPLPPCMSASYALKSVSGASPSITSLPSAAVRAAHQTAPKPPFHFVRPVIFFAKFRLFPDITPPKPLKRYL